MRAPGVDRAVPSGAVPWTPWFGSPDSYARSTTMGFEAFEHYLSDDSRRGPAPDGAFSGAAGGAPCG
ncbi:MAG: hypothetical protein AABM42_11420, partial [Actinomycetota bacterium]